VRPNAQGQPKTADDGTDETIKKVLQIPLMICKFAFAMLFARLYFTALEGYPGNTGGRMTIVCQ